MEINNCPICGCSGEMVSCYNTITNADYIEGFNPIRTWLMCKNCNHIFAHNYPANMNELLAATSFEFNMNPKVQLLPFLGDIMSRIKEKVQGNKLLEVGVGAGEMTAVAKEFLFDVTGIDIRPAYANAVSKMLNIKVHTCDFMEFKGDGKYDVVCMGDVIEHMPDPMSALDKAAELLQEKGILWLSTPNFESAYSYMIKDRDPMWRVCEHINYFSYRSLVKALKIKGFEVFDYRVSRHYNGSMELIALKL